MRHILACGVVLVALGFAVPALAAEEVQVRRSLPASADCGAEVTVTLQIDAPEEGGFWGIDEVPPRGWPIVEVGQGGSATAHGHARWAGLSSAPPEVVQYKLRVPTATDAAAFQGTFQYGDEGPSPVAGDDEISIPCLGTVAQTPMREVRGSDGLPVERAACGETLSIWLDAGRPPEDATLFRAVDRPPPGWTFSDPNGDGEYETVRFGQPLATTALYALEIPRGIDAGDYLLDEGFYQYGKQDNTLTELMPFPDATIAVQCDGRTGGGGGGGGGTSGSSTSTSSTEGNATRSGDSRDDGSGDGRQGAAGNEAHNAEDLRGGPDPVLWTVLAVAVIGGAVAAGFVFARPKP